ncbi:MAG: glycosyl hydrolase family 5 [Pelagibacterium sp. SCN 64-44]|nr:MAG: glycosyl hydrolase family 5 [Pelagibacterium sp. SCN 64-44]
MRLKSKRLRPLLAAIVLGCTGTLSAQAQLIANPVATFAGLDKITGRITRFDVYINETVLFGALEITPRACYNRPANDTLQRTSAFLEVNQMSLDGTGERIFTGWMFADSPALNAVDHAVYDVWLIECKTSTNVPPPDQR